MMNLQIARLLPAGTANPVPIILDSNLKLNPESKLMLNYRSGTGRQPLIFTKIRSSDDIDPEYNNRQKLLERNGAKIYYIESNDGGQVNYPPYVF